MFKTRQKVNPPPLLWPGEDWDRVFSRLVNATSLEDQHSVLQQHLEGRLWQLRCLLALASTPAKEMAQANNCGFLISFFIWHFMWKVVNSRIFSQQ